MLLLDEPMAGLGPAESRQMVDVLEPQRAPAMLLVEHDRTRFSRSADRISVLVYGRLIATGTGT
jgi:branched-chain amino acid transport system ATP-binding protein